MSFDYKNINIATKFNTALEVIARYHKLQISSTGGAKYLYSYIRHNTLNILPIQTITSIGEYTLCIDDLAKNGYSNLIPFFKIWMAEIKDEFAEMVTKEDFIKINTILSTLKIYNNG